MEAISRKPVRPKQASRFDLFRSKYYRLPAKGVPSQSQLQRRVHHFLARQGQAGDHVLVVVTDGFEAHALGSVAEGSITIGRKLMKRLTADEIDFVLAHEVVHLTEFHLLGRLPFNLMRRLYNAVGKTEPTIQIALHVWDLVKIVQHTNGDIPPAEALTKEQELQADAGAVKLTGKLAPALSALTKLVHGNLDAPSHTWEALSVAIPLFSMRERLSELRKTFPGWE